MRRPEYDVTVRAESWERITVRVRPVYGQHAGELGMEVACRIWEANEINPGRVQVVSVKKVEEP